MPRRASVTVLGAVAVVGFTAVVVATSPGRMAAGGAVSGVAAVAGPGTGPMLPAPPGAAVTDLPQNSRPVLLSTNWSGYAATAPAKFTSAKSDFLQPSIVCTGAPGLFVAAWVGLDGFRDKTVEQDGTFATCTGPRHMTPTYVAWYEMFPAGSVEIFGVNAGDEIQPAVAFADGRFALSIADASTGQSQSFTAAPGGAVVGHGADSHHRLGAVVVVQQHPDRHDPAQGTDRGVAR